MTIIPNVVNEQTIHCLDETSTVQQAAEQMIEHNVSAIVVVDDDNELIGIVTERDMTRRVVAPSLAADRTQLKEDMTRDPETLSPQDIPHEALQRMVTGHFRHLPVVEEGRVIGMVSMRDLRQSVATYSSVLAL